MNWYGRRQGYAMGKKRTLALGRIDAFDVQRWHNAWPKKTWLEIGFGFGESLLSLLEQDREVSVIGCEVFKNGLAHCLANLKEEDTARVAFFSQPVQELLPFLPKESLEGVIVFFPDPWPKKRHHKRRLLQGATLDALVSLIKPGGEIRFASDHKDLVSFTVAILNGHTQLAWRCGLKTGEEEVWSPWPQDWPTSRYHEKATARGVPCAHSAWVKKH